VQGKKNHQLKIGKVVGEKKPITGDCPGTHHVCKKVTAGVPLIRGLRKITKGVEGKQVAETNSTETETGPKTLRRKKPERKEKNTLKKRRRCGNLGEKKQEKCPTKGNVELKEERQKTACRG